VLIDLDGTILKNFSTLEEGLKLLYGLRIGTQKYFGLMDLVITTSPEEIMLIAEKELIEGGFNRKHLKKINEKMMTKIDYDLIKAIKNNLGNKTIIVATKSSNTLAIKIANKFSFFAGIGTQLMFNQRGQMSKSKILISDNNKVQAGHVFRTKLKLAKEKFKTKHNNIHEKEIAIITDAITDLEIMKKCGLVILIRNSHPTFLQKVCEKYKLYDIFLYSKRDYSKLNQL